MWSQGWDLASEKVRMVLGSVSVDTESDSVGSKNSGELGMQMLCLCPPEQGLISAGLGQRARVQSTQLESGACPRSPLFNSSRILGWWVVVSVGAGMVLCCRFRNGNNCKMTHFKSVVTWPG